MTVPVWTVHVAGPPAGVQQKCIACGFVLDDVTAWVEGRVAVVAGTDVMHSWLPTGARIGTDRADGAAGGCTYVIQGRPLNHDERLCVGAN